MGHDRDHDHELAATAAETGIASPLSKRDFLKVAGIATFGLAGMARSADKPERWDLIVVGGGNAGLPVAIFAAQRGARVLIVEAAGALGGTLFLSSGQMSAAGTKLLWPQGRPWWMQ